MDPATQSGTRNISPLNTHVIRHDIKKNTHLVQDDAVAYFEIGEGYCTGNYCVSLHVTDTKQLMQGNSMGSVHVE
jgi:hypothetical protein